jgi:hypothetical protein
VFGTSDLIRRIKAQRKSWKARHARLDEITSRQICESVDVVARSRDLLARSKRLCGGIKKPD